MGSRRASCVLLVLRACSILLLPKAHCSWRMARCSLVIHHSSFLAAGCVLPAACCLLLAACCWQLAACCLLPAACCLLLAAGCVLPAACCVLLLYHVFSRTGKQLIQRRAMRSLPLNDSAGSRWRKSPRFPACPLSLTLLPSARALYRHPRTPHSQAEYV